MAWLLRSPEETQRLYAWFSLFLESGRKDGPVLEFPRSALAIEDVSEGARF